MMNFKSFSKYLLETGDIDPDYIFIREFAKRKKFSKEVLLHWLMLKVVIYDSVSELEHLLHKVPFEKLRFGAERRKAKPYAKKYYTNLITHFGSNAMSSVKQLTKMENPLDGVNCISGFGPWAAWKFIDLLDCCLLLDLDLSKVDFRKAYEFPLKGILMINGHDEDVSLLKDDKLYNKCMAEIRKQLKDIKNVKTPHNSNRGIRINEIETLLCKYHSYMHGHYHPGEDIMRLMKNIKSSQYDDIRKFPNIW